MKTTQKRLALAGAVASLTVFSSVGFSSVADAAVPECEVGSSAARAYLCVESIEKFYGVFSTFKYLPFEYSGNSAADALAENAVQVMTDVNGAPSEYYMGLQVRNTPKGAEYQPFWTENGSSYEYHAIGDPAAEADGRNHSYMSLPSLASENSWDMFYDFNPVGATRMQTTSYSQRLTAGWRLDYEVAGVRFPATQNRVQYLSGNREWGRFKAERAYPLNDTGECVQGADPAYCFDTVINKGTGDESSYVNNWQVAKPGAAPMMPEASRVYSSNRDVVNGVDQHLLRQCMAKDPSSCFDEVPGLRNCVNHRWVCNSDTALNRRSRIGAISAQQARNLAVAHENVAGSDGAINAELVSIDKYDARMGTNLSLQGVHTGSVWHISSKRPMRELTGEHRIHQGYVLAIDSRTGQILHAKVG